MSYVRLGEDGSDVYVFGTHFDGEEAFTCCACLFRKEEWVSFEGTHFLGGYLRPLPGDPGPFYTIFRAKMLDHLRDHLAAGHCVPDYVFTNIWEETEWGQP